MTMTLQSEAARIDALRAVLSNLNGSDQSFARSMLGQFYEYGRLSVSQWEWIDKLAVKAQPAPVFTGGDDGEFASIADLFAKAAKSAANPKGLVHPKLRFDLSGIDPAWRGDLLIKRAGDNARYPGSLNVTNGMPYGDFSSVYYGRIHKDGRFEASRDCTDTVRGVLIAVNADPAAVAGAYGVKTGNCCFCSTPLSDARSTSVGYGPICAARFGLPWGTTPSAPLIDNDWRGVRDQMKREGT